MADKIKNLLDGQNLTRRYILACLFIIILGMLGIGRWVNQQTTNVVNHRTSATMVLFVDSFLAYHL